MTDQKFHFVRLYRSTPGDIDVKPAPIEELDNFEEAASERLLSYHNDWTNEGDPPRHAEVLDAKGNILFELEVLSPTETGRVVRS